EYEALQKEMTPKVKAYLADMEIDRYWIDRMFAANSQEQYVPTWAEADVKSRHLMGMVPSLEEVVLSKCKEDPDVDRKLRAFRAGKSGPMTADDLARFKEIIHDSEVFYRCSETALSDMQDVAFERENETIVNDKCGQPLTKSEISTVKALM